MEQTPKHKAWNIEELSYLYHLCMWGYDSKEITSILIPILGRTSDSLSNQVCNMRKYITMELGLPVFHWDVGPNTEAKFKQATNSGVPISIVQYKRNKDMRAPTTRQVAPKEIIAEINSPILPVLPSVIPIQVDKEPDILDVMKMAKELGAAEVEYKGMKIKY